MHDLESAGSGGASGGLSLGVLGGVWAEFGGVRLALGGPRQRAVLGALIAARGSVLTLEQLVDSVWEDDPPAAAVGTVQTYISNLRRVLEPGRAARDVSRVLVTAAPGYVLRVDPDAVDAWRFEQAVLGSADDADPVQRRAVLARALRLWGGEPFAGIGGAGWVAAEAARLHELRWAALEQLSELLLGAGAYGEAEENARVVTVEAPLREEGWRLLALAQYAGGRAGDGLATLRRAREVLDEELGIDPGPALQQLEQQMLNREVPTPFTPEHAMTPAAATGERIEPHSPSARDPFPDETPPSAQLPGYRGARVIGAPVQLRPLVGREAEVRGVGQLLTRSRLVTITGPGGSGKTRLALAAAEYVAADFPDGAHFVTLQTVSDVAAVWSLLASGLGIEAGAGDARVAVSRALASRRLLLVLDNLEHLDGADTVIAELLSAPQLRVLATSRRPLLLSGEQEFTLNVLPLPSADTVDAVSASDAGRLFCECARAARPGFVLDDSSAAAVARLCRRLDGLPLALELAAAQLRFFTPGALVAHLDHQLSVELGRGLTAGDRPERHRTLGAAIGYSHDLLSDEDQLVFRRLGVFAGPVPIEAITAVVSDAPSSTQPLVTDLFGSLTRLTLAGLVRVDPGADNPRFGMLDTIRDYALTRLVASGEHDALRRQHLLWCRDVTVAAWQSVNFRGVREEFAVAGQVIDEIRAALHYAFGATRNAAPDAVADSDVDVVAAAADALSSIAIPWSYGGGGAEIQAWLDTALRLVSRERDPNRYLELARLRGFGSVFAGNAGPQVITLERLLAEVPDGDSLLVGRLNFTLGYALVAAGEADTAVDAYLTGARHAESAGALGFAAVAMAYATEAAVQAGQRDAALQIARDTVAFITQRRLPSDPVYYTAATSAAAVGGNLTEAAAYLARAIADLRGSRRMENFESRSGVVRGGSYLAAALGRGADAARLLAWWQQWCVTTGLAVDAEHVPSHLGGPGDPWDAAIRADLVDDEWAQARASGATLSVGQCLALLDDVVADASARGGASGHDADGRRQPSASGEHR